MSKVETIKQLDADNENDAKDKKKKIDDLNNKLIEMVSKLKVKIGIDKTRQCISKNLEKDDSL